MNIFVVGCGGFIGAVSRYLVSLGIGKHFSGNMPIATMLVNIIGSFLIGFFNGLLQAGEHRRLLLFLTTGFLGGFTTFSTFSLETMGLFESGDTMLGGINIMVTLGGCFFGVWLGKIIGKRVA